MTGDGSDAAGSLPGAARHRRDDLLVFGLFFCAFLLNAPDRGPTGDAHDYFVPVTSLVDHGQLAAPPEVFIWDRDLLVGPDGGRYTLFPVGQSLAMLPFYAVGRALGGALGSEIVPLAVLNASSALWAALAVLCVWKTLTRVLAVPARWALCTCALYGFGTMLAPYGKVLYSEALQSYLVAALVYVILSPRTARTLPMLGLLFGLLVLTKPIHLALAPVLLGAALRRGHLVAPERRGLVGGVFFAGLCAALFFGWNALRTGNPFDAYGDAPANLEQNQLALRFLPESLRVLFVSPLKNLFLFNPVLVLAAVGALVPDAKRERAFLLGYFALSLVVFGVFKNATRQGEIAWGPRYAMVFLPALMPFVARFFTWVSARAPGPRRALLVAACAVSALSLYVQLLACTYDMFDPKVAVCGTYETLQKRLPTLPPCDGEALSSSIVAVHHYLFWHADAATIDAGAAPEFPWITEHYEPTLAQRVLALPRVRSRVLDENTLFFPLPGGALALQLVRALLIAGVFACLAGLVRVLRGSA